MKSKKVLLVSEYFYPHWTGIVQSFVVLSRQLLNRGYHVSVLTTQYDKSLKRVENWEDIHIFREPYLVKLLRTHYSIQVIWKYMKVVSNYDVVVINSPNSNILFFALIAKLFGKKMLIYHQGDLIMPKMTSHFWRYRITEKIFDVCTIISMGLCDKVSSFTKDYAENSRVMRFFLYKFFAYIPLRKLKVSKPNSSFKIKIDKLKQEYTIIGFAGRFVEEKGFDILIESIPLVVKELGKVMFVFAGEKNVTYENFFSLNIAQIEKNKDNIVFLGLLKDGDLVYYYKNLDVFVLSSRSDCFALTQMEAAQFKVPLVVTNIPGARMLVKSTGFGELVESENAKSLAKGIVKVIKNKNVYTKRHEKVKSFLKNYSVFDID